VGKNRQDKRRNRSVHQHYEIEVSSEGATVQGISWHRKASSEPQSGLYFIRTNCDIKDEILIWDIYNTIREVESTFRCLKTDLSLRPIYHQEDPYVEAHLYLGLLAYQVVAPIRHILKEKRNKPKLEEHSPDNEHTESSVSQTKHKGRQ